MPKIGTLGQVCANHRILAVRPPDYNVFDTAAVVSFSAGVDTLNAVEFDTHKFVFDCFLLLLSNTKL